MTGGRKWPFHHRPEMRASLLMFRRAGIERLGQGEARGADRLAAELWAELGGEVVPYEANWRPHGYVDKTAGHRRNIEMIEAERPDVVLGYPDEQSSGTWHCIAEALRRDILCAVLMPWADGRHAAIVAALRGISLRARHHRARHIPHPRFGSTPLSRFAGQGPRDMVESTGISRASMIKRRVIHLEGGDNFILSVQGFVRALDVTRALTSRRVARISMLTTPDDRQVYKVRFRLARADELAHIAGFHYLGMVGKVAVFVDQTAERFGGDPDPIHEPGMQDKITHDHGTSNPPSNPGKPGDIGPNPPVSPAAPQPLRVDVEPDTDVSIRKGPDQVEADRQRGR